MGADKATPGEHGASREVWAPCEKNGSSVPVWQSDPGEGQREERRLQAEAVLREHEACWKVPPSQHMAGRGRGLVLCAGTTSIRVRGPGYSDPWLWVKFQC